MDAASYNRVMALFDAACDLSPPEQQRVIVEARAQDAAVGARLEQMLAHDASEMEVLAPGAGARALAQQAADGWQTVAAGARKRRQGSHVGGVEVGGWLGQGSMGSVHRGRMLADGSPVAIKFLIGDGEGVAARRLRREFETLSRLDHSGCVKVFAHGHTEEGDYLVMEYVAGGDLASRIGRRGPYELRILAEVCDALAYIHERGVVHRDLKPANVLLTDGTPVRAKLADFGIAKTPDATTLLTGSNELLGSLDFLAPEQCRGRAADPRSDLYALGCVIHVLWTGEAPFGGDNVERLAARMKRRPPPLDTLADNTPAPLAALVQALMSPRPEDRPEAASTVAPQLRALAEASR